MKLMDLIIEELNNNLSEEEKEQGAHWERIHSEQYEIVDTEDGRFRNKVSK